MKITLELKIEAKSPEAFRRMVNEAVRRLCQAHEYDIAQHSQTESNDVDGVFHWARDIEVEPLDSKQGGET